VELVGSLVGNGIITFMQLITRICNKCKTEKAITEFYRHKQKKDGYMLSCKICERTRDLNRHKKIKESLEFIEAETKVCYNCELELPKSEFHKNSWTLTRLSTYCKKCSANRRLIRYYGINLEQKELIFLEQNKACAICKIQYDMNELSVDHNHISGKRRGLLCPSCNTALGLLRENKIILNSMKEYIDKWQNEEKRDT
jgi:hypothetical protein